jgi:hypothetical protein
MKSILSVVLIATCLCSLGQDPKNVLFVGNSYVYTNDLPQVLDDLAASLSKILIHESSTPSGYTFEGHTTNVETQNLLMQGDWDHVVLQEQSQIPALELSSVEENVFPYASQLVDDARASSDCCMPIFMMTWGRQDGDETNCGSWPPVCTYEGQQELLTERYVQMAVDNECWTAPIGEAWRIVREETDDNIGLYIQDGSHPTVAGTYLAACVLFATIWNQTPVGAPYIAGLDPADAAYLQSVAASTVFDDPEAWNHIPLLSADIIFGGVGASVSVTLDLSPAMDSALVTGPNGSNIWLDGDLSGYFLSPGTHYWTVTAYSPCGQIFFIDSVVVLANDVPLNPSIEFSVYPNPARDYLTIAGIENSEKYEIYDRNGRLVREEKFTEQEIRVDIRSLAAGAYELVIWTNDKRKSVSFVKAAD